MAVMCAVVEQQSNPSTETVDVDALLDRFLRGLEAMRAPVIHSETLPGIVDPDDLEHDNVVDRSPLLHSTTAPIPIKTVSGKTQKQHTRKGNASINSTTPLAQARAAALAEADSLRWSCGRRRRSLGRAEEIDMIVVPDCLDECDVFSGRSDQMALSSSFHVLLHLD